MSHTPWTKEEAEAMAYNAVVKSGCTDENDKMRIAEGFYACLAWAEDEFEKFLEEAPTLYQHIQPDIWCEVPYDEQRLSKNIAKLVVVRPIVSDERGSKDQ